MKGINEMIVQKANKDTGACYGVANCAEIVFERGKMVKGESLEVVNEIMKTIDPTRIRFIISKDSSKLMVFK